jgi:hypothetical protein
MNIEKNSLFKYFGEAWLVMGLNIIDNKIYKLYSNNQIMPEDYLIAGVFLTMKA